LGHVFFTQKQIKIQRRILGIKPADFVRGGFRQNVPFGGLWRIHRKVRLSPRRNYSSAELGGTFSAAEL